MRSTASPTPHARRRTTPSRTPSARTSRSTARGWSRESRPTTGARRTCSRHAPRTRDTARRRPTSGTSDDLRRAVMQRNDVTRARVRELAEANVEGAKVLSVYLNLDPGELGTQPARATAFRSVIDEASRAVRESEGLAHDEQAGLRADVERLESFLEQDFSADGVHGLAAFSSSPAGLFEVIRLPRAPQTRVVVADAPYIEPLVRLGMETRWVVLLVSRSDGRVLRGSSRHLAEVQTLDENVHQQHSQGGWSQARYERSVDEDARRHVARVIAALQERVARRPFDLLLYAAPDELGSAFIEEQLGDELRGRLAGRFSCDVSHSSPQEVLEAAHDAMLMAESRRERETLDRLADALGMGARASSSLD